MRVTVPDFAQIVSVQRPTIYKMIQRGNLLVGEDKLIDLDCPLTQKYLKKKGINTGAIQDKQVDIKEIKKSKAQIDQGRYPGKKPTHTIVNIKKEMADTKLAAKKQAELRAEFPGLPDKMALEYVKLEIDLEIKMLELEKRKGALIDRQRTVNFLFAHLDVLHKKLLHLPNQVASRILAIATSSDEGAKQAIVSLLVSSISKSLKDTRNLVIKTDQDLQE